MQMHVSGHVEKYLLLELSGLPFGRRIIQKLIKISATEYKSVFHRNSVKKKRKEIKSCIFQFFT